MMKSPTSCQFENNGFALFLTLLVKLLHFKRMYLYLHVLIDSIKHHVLASNINEILVLTTLEHSLQQIPQRMLIAYPTLSLSPLVSSS